jgi:hypothetical protein
MKPSLASVPPLAAVGPPAGGFGHRADRLTGAPVVILE